MRRAPACAAGHSRSGSAGLRHQHGGLRVRQHERQPLRRVAGIERQVGGAGLEDADQPDHHLGRALDAQPTTVSGPTPERAQMMRQLVGVRVELGVAQRALLEHQRQRVRRAGGLRGKQLRQRRRRHRPRGRVPQLAGWWRARDGASTSSAPIGRSGAAAAAASSRISRSASTSTLPRSNRSLAYSSTPPSPAGRPVRAAPLRHAQRQVELRARAGHLLEAAPQARQTPAPPTPPRPGTPASPGTTDAATASAPGSAPPPAAQTAAPAGRRPQGCRTAPDRQLARSSGCPDVSVRSTSVLTKNPTRSSSAASRAARDRAAERDVARPPQAASAARTARPAAP